MPDDMFHVPDLQIDDLKFHGLVFMCSIGLVSENYVPEISGPYNTNSSWPEQKGDNVTNYTLSYKI